MKYYYSDEINNMLIELKEARNKWGELYHNDENVDDIEIKINSLKCDLYYLCFDYFKGNYKEINAFEKRFLW